VSSVVEAPRKRVRLDPSERREQILRAAARLFDRRPYSDVSVADIADAAGIARGLPHYYFGSKRELYLEVVRRAVMVPSMAAALAGDDESADSVWQDSVDGFLRLVREHPEPPSMAVRGLERDDALASILDASKEIVADNTLAALGLADRADDPVLRALVRGYGGFVQELTIEWLERGRLDEGQVRAAPAAAQ
jgi:AcrR family transcriptional regulator